MPWKMEREGEREKDEAKALRETNPPHHQVKHKQIYEQV